jgi:glycosyltransferase involved in cell wall biosynthesis
VRALIFPSYEFPSDYRADSSFILTKAFAKFLASQGHFVTWFVPHRYGEKGKEEEPIPGVETIPYDFVATRDEHEMVFYDKLIKYNPIWGSRPVDFVVTNNAGIGGRLAEFFNVFGGGGYRPVPVYIWDFSTKYVGSDELQTEETNLLFHQTGYASCHTFLFSEFQKKAVLEAARLTMSPSWFNRIDKNLQVVPIAFSPAEVTAAIEGVEKEKVPTFFFSGRFTNTKGGERAIELADYLFRSGREVKVIICTARENPRLTKVMEGRRQGAVEIHTGLSQRDMWRQMARCHYGIFIQSLKMFPSSPHEWLYAGLMVAFQDYGHEKKILKPGYPLLFKSTEEGVTLLRYMMEHHDELKEKLADVSQWTADHYSRDTGMARMLATINERSYPRKPAKRLAELVERCVKEGLTSLTFSQLQKEVINRAYTKNMIFASRSNRGSFPMLCLYDTALRYYDDDHQSEDPRLTAKSVQPKDELPQDADQDVDKE